MNNYKTWIRENKRISGPLFAIVSSIIVVVLSVYVFGELMFMVPVVTFFSFHYTGLYKFKLRLLAGAIVFIVVAFVATAFLTHAIYNSDPVYKTSFTDGSNVTASVSPYSGTSSQFTYTIYIIPNGSFDFNSLDLNIHAAGGYSKTIAYSEMTNSTFANGSREITYIYDAPNTNVYSYNLTAQKNGTIFTPEISGPLHSSEFTVYTYLLPSYALYYLMIYELIFVIGLFIARSISNSKRYSMPPPDRKK